MTKNEYLPQEGPPARMAPSLKEIEVCRLAGELGKMTLNAPNYWPGSLHTMARELKKVLKEE